MANKINIAQVPEVATISQLLGVDANNKWAKIPGAKFATAEQLTAVDNRATNAQTAANAATQTANQAQKDASKASSDANLAQVKVSQIPPIWSLLRDTHLVSGNTVDIWCGWFVDGTGNPKATTPPMNQALSFRALYFKDFGIGKHVHLYGETGSAYYGMAGELTVMAVAPYVELHAGDSADAAAVLACGGDFQGDTVGPMMFSMRFVGGDDSTRPYIAVRPLVNCHYRQYIEDSVFIGDEGGESGGSEGGGSVTVDSALSTTSTNPVENKAVTAALNNKAGLVSPGFTGTPTAPTAKPGTSTKQLATTAFVTDAVDDVSAAVDDLRADVAKVVGALPAEPYLYYTEIDAAVPKEEQWIQNGQLFYCESEKAEIALKKGIMPNGAGYVTCYIMCNTPTFTLTIAEAVETGGWEASFTGLQKETLIEVVALNRKGLYRYSAGVISTNRIS